MKIALITGANKGIGLETARQLAQQGMQVLLAARDGAKAKAAAESLQAEGLSVTPIVLDVTNPETIAAAVATVTSQYGHLDILVNNAGILADASMFGNQTSNTSAAVMRTTLETNVIGVMEVTAAFLPLLRLAPAARIVNLSSILGSLTFHATEGSPIYEAKGSVAYNISKTALNQYTVHLAHELKGTKIKVNSAHPGWVKTEMGGEGATMELVDGAKTSVQLATLPEDGPTGGYFHMGDALPW